MKKYTYIICLLAILLNSQLLPAKWDYERKFKVFRQIHLFNDSLDNKFGNDFSKIFYIGRAMAFWDDSTIVCHTSFEIDKALYKYPTLSKINIFSGRYGIFADSNNSDIHTAKTYPTFTSISKQGNYFVAYHNMSELDEIRKGIYIFGKDKLSRFITNDSISRQMREKIEISDCAFTAEGKLFVLAIYPDKNEAGVLSSSDLGMSWEKKGNPVTQVELGINSWGVNRFHLVGDETGRNYQFFTAPDFYDLNKNYYIYSNDAGLHWNNNALPNKNLKDVLWPLKYYISNTPGSTDTLYAMKYYDDLSAEDLYVSYDRALNWKLILTREKNGYTGHTFTSQITEFVSSRRIYVPVINGIGLTTNAGETWCKYADKPDSNHCIVRIRMLDNIRGVAFTIDTTNSYSRIYYFEIDDNFCGNDGFEYVSLLNQDGLALKGNAARIGEYARLTLSKANQSGALWRDNAISFDKSFKCSFGFQLDEGVNNENDSTSPGADGVALVITKEIPTAPGEVGGGIGYNGISSAVAIEFDSFVNKSREDPNYDHAAVFASRGALNNNHTSTDCLGTANISGKLIANGTKHKALLKYDKLKNTMEVYFDDTGEVSLPALSIKDFEFEKFLGSPLGFIGITSATGESFETHSISDFQLCFNGESGLGVDEPIQPISSWEKAFPNPARETINIELPKEITEGNVEAIIFNQIGNEVSRQMVQIGIGQVSLNVGGLPKGVYFARILVDGKFVSVPFVKE